MKIFLIAAISVISFLFLSFIVFLLLIKPNKKREEMKRFIKTKYAHRGLHGHGKAENSLSAFRDAVEMGFGIELDVRLSSDGKLVVFHDDTLERVTKERGRVDSKTAAELSKIKLCGTEDAIPTFKEVLRLVNGRVPLLVEIKEDAGKYGVTRKTVEILKEYKGDFIIESFNPLSLRVVRKEMPEVLRGFLSQNFLTEKKYRKPLYFLLQNLLLNCICRPDFIAFKHSHYKNSALKLTRDMFGVATLAWTVTSIEEENAAYENGFDSVIFENYIPKRR